MKKGRRFTQKQNTISYVKPLSYDTQYGEDEKFDMSFESDDSVYDDSGFNDEIYSSSNRFNSDTMSVRDKKKKIKQDKKLRNKNKSKHSVKYVFDDFSSKSRRALSYEDLPLDEREKSNIFNVSKNLRLHKKNIFLASVIIVLLVVIVLAFTNRDNLTFTNIKNWVEYGVLNMDKDERFPVDIQGSSVTAGNFNRIGSNLVYSSDTQFVTMNSYGKTIFTYQQRFSNPVLVTASNSDLSLVYNLGGTGFVIHSLEENIYSGTAENNIIVADIAKNGTYALVTQSNGYLSKLYVYSNDNKQIFAYSFADYYITAVALDPSGKKAVLSGVSAHNGKEICAVYVLDFTEKEPVVFNEFEDNIVYDISFLSNKYVSIIGRSAVYGLNVRNGDFKTTDYNGRTITAYYVNKDTNTLSLSLSRSGDGRMCDILYFSSSVDLQKTIETDLRIASLSTYKNRIAALSYDEVYMYSKDGRLISQKKAGLDPTDIILYSTSDAYVLGISEISKISL